MKRPALDQQQISQGLADSYWRVSVHDEVTSTQLLLRKSNPVPGVVIVAEYQSQGRGRLGRSFDSKSGSGLLFSAYVRPSLEDAKWGLLPLLVGTTIAQVLNNLTNSNHYLTKWPNDVVAPEGKVCGVLCEYSDNGVLVGIGINVTTEIAELPVPTASSIILASEMELDRNELLISLLTALAMNIAAWEAGADILADYLMLSSTINQEVEVTLPGSRTLRSEAIGISADGGLILASGETVTVGDVLHLRNQVK